MQLDSGDKLTLTVAMGAASLTDQGNPERTLFQAEQALLAAKGMGGNRVMFAVDCQDIPA
jgi:GGDEF domain-containing protein